MTLANQSHALKDVIRLQFDVRRAQFNIIEALVETCGLSSKKELFSNAMALLKWAVQETQKGRRIASYDPENGSIELVALPGLDLVQHHDSHRAAASNLDAENESAARERPALGLVRS